MKTYANGSLRTDEYMSEEQWQRYYDDKAMTEMLLRDPRMVVVSAIGHVNGLFIADPYSLLDDAYGILWNAYWNIR